MISEEVIFELQLAKTVMAALRGHYSDLGNTRILDIQGTYQNKDSIEGLVLNGLSAYSKSQNFKNSAVIMLPT